MAQLAIKGHATRGGEIIKILEMLGANNTYQLSGNEDYAYYVIESGEIRVGDIIFGNEPYIMFTLEEFLEKFPYKVGDKAKLDGWPCIITEMSWGYDDVVYSVKGVDFSKRVCSKDLQPYKEENFGECIEKTIQECLFGKEAQMYLNELANKRTEEIVQALKPAKEIMDRKYNVEEYLKVWKETEKGLEVVVNDRFELKEDNGKFYIIKKPVQYPKTYEACCGIMGISYQAQLSYPNPDAERGNTYLTKEKQLLDSLKRLRICRNAYWKIAGEEMRLGQPWEPNWNNDSQFKYIISCRRDKIIKDTNTAKNSILAFPTAEMRDAFYENFKDLIEECKEFL